MILTLAGALILLGYTMVYSGASNLTHGPGQGVGFLEALGLTAAGKAATGKAPAPSGGSGSAGPQKPPPPGRSTTGTPGRIPDVPIPLVPGQGNLT